MCGKPKIVQQDPEGDALKAAEKATAEANAKRAGRRTGGSMGSSMSVLGGEGGEGDDRNLSNTANALVNSKYGALFQKKSKLGGG